MVLYLHADHEYGDDVADDTGCRYGDQTGHHEAVVEVPLADFGGTGTVKVDGGDIGWIVGDKEVTVG